MRDRYLVSMVELGDKFSVLMYDLKKSEVVHEVVDYGEKLINSLKLKRLSIHQEIGHLRVFVGFMASRRASFASIDDKFLECFRGFLWGKLKSSKSDDPTVSDKARKTVNAKLVRVYDWLKWMQETGRVPDKLIGADGCRIFSCLVGSSISVNSKKNLNYKYSDRYPLLLEVRTRNSKHRVPKFIPNEDMVDALHKYFHGRKNSLHIRHRNSLLIDIASYTGFRRNSIQSLVVSQFIGNDFEYTERDTVKLRPARQKFNYGDYYEIPVELHQNVCNFINEYRATAISRFGERESKSKGAVFISDRTGAPLDDRSITAIVSTALRSCGAPKGFSIHSFRSKYLVEATAIEYEDRKTLGLDTSAESIMRAVSAKVGHRNHSSVRPYTAGHEASTLVKHHNEQAKREKNYLEEIARLRKHIELLDISRGQKT